MGGLDSMLSPASKLALEGACISDEASDFVGKTQFQRFFSVAPQIPERASEPNIKERDRGQDHENSSASIAAETSKKDKERGGEHEGNRKKVMEASKNGKDRGNESE